MFPAGRFATVLADPPWQYNDKLSARVKRGAARHYDVMPLDDIRALPVRCLAEENAHLYLCTTNPFLSAAFSVMEAWGFKYKTTLTWVKVTRAGQPRIGMGHYFRGCTEPILFGVRGKLPLLARNLPNVFMAERTSHSTKPDELYNLVQSASPGPRVELFARTARPGWSGWGNEYPGGQ